jgi:hypothetical protein
LCPDQNQKDDQMWVRTIEKLRITPPRMKLDGVDAELSFRRWREDSAHDLDDNWKAGSSGVGMILRLSGPGAESGSDYRQNDVFAKKIVDALSQSSGVNLTISNVQFNEGGHEFFIMPLQTGRSLTSEQIEGVCSSWQKALTPIQDHSSKVVTQEERVRQAILPIVASSHSWNEDVINGIVYRAVATLSKSK